MAERRSEKWVVFYLAFQGLCGGAWWIALLFEDIRNLFLPSIFPDQVLWAIFASDILLFVFASLVSAVLIYFQYKHSSSICWLLLGATLYATLMSWSWWLMTGEAPLGPILMTFAGLGTAAAAWRI